MKNFNADDNKQARGVRHEPEFGKRKNGVAKWENFGTDAESERGVMVAEFHLWLTRTRIETEKQMISSERHQRSIAPFAKAGLDGAETPADVPMVVLEFATQALETMELKRKMDLLNVYYGHAALTYCDVNLSFDAKDEAEVNALWDWFIEERGQQ